MLAWLADIIMPVVLKLRSDGKEKADFKIKYLNKFGNVRLRNHQPNKSNSHGANLNVCFLYIFLLCNNDRLNLIVS